jgi:two-component system sensor histidine kinase HydH
VAQEFPDVPTVVDGDPEQLHQVFVNLSLNSIEAMAQGGQLRVAMSANRNGAGTCEVMFQDSGPGIPEEVLERIFEPFVTSKEHGTGLGLAISRRIVEEHGGTLVAANREQGGAAFTVKLPLSQAERSDTTPSGTQNRWRPNFA